MNRKEIDLQHVQDLCTFLGGEDHTVAFTHDFLIEDVGGWLPEKKCSLGSFFVNSTTNALTEYVRNFASNDKVDGQLVMVLGDPMRDLLENGKNKFFCVTITPPKRDYLVTEVVRRAGYAIVIGMYASDPQHITLFIPVVKEKPEVFLAAYLHNENTGVVGISISYDRYPAVHPLF